MQAAEMSATTDPWVLQLCHGYSGPFMDCARQYAVLFKHTRYKVCTVYLTGTPSLEVEQGSASDEVIFLNYSSQQIRGLKLSAILELKRIIASRSFSFCIAHRFKPIYVALLSSSLPVIGVHHAFGGYKRRSRRFFVNRFKSRLALLGVSDAVRDDIRSSLPGWSAARIQKLYNRIDVKKVQCDQVSREVARQYLNLPPDAWVLGNVGRLHPDKDQATLIRGFASALPSLPEGSLLAIMGSGRLECSLKKIAEDMNISDSVRFLGQVPHGRRYFKALDAFALTSDHEPFGMVLLEAMAAGISIICSDCGGGREVVSGVGQLFPLGDYEALSTCVIKAYEECGDTEQVYGNWLESRFSDNAATNQFWSLKDVLI